MIFSCWTGRLNVSFKFLLCVSLFSHRMGQQDDDMFRPRVDWISDPVFDDVIVRLDTTVDLPAQMCDLPPAQGVNMTNAQCAEACMQQLWCSSLFTDLKNDKCLLHEVIFFIPDAGRQREVAPGARYFRRTDPSCLSTEGFYHWRNERLCVKPLLQTSYSVKSVGETKLRGRLLNIETVVRMDCIRKFLLQMPPSISLSVPFVVRNSTAIEKVLKDVCTMSPYIKQYYDYLIFGNKWLFKVDV